ncbi:MAG: sulfite exporter TauE/SafE family protein [Dehalococcoidia bacterium]|nr:MAG: sulfite exporter TauE/SafE family protein [Dehalococcoidia bacterium]
MSNEVIILAGTAATIGFIHTILGPDHYLPFIVLSKARHWNNIKTFLITLLCGIGHVLSSIILGFIGIALGIAIFKLEAIESFRGEIAAWLLLAFGFTYFIWGIHRAIRKRSHDHVHAHEDGGTHIHLHNHLTNHSHPHDVKVASLTPWILFTIFVFGPCEPLIPLIMYPAARNDIPSVAIVASIFALVTIGTMLSIVLLSSYGLSRLPLRRLERYSHALAGLAIFLSGGAIKFLGL